jgi:ABC-type nitrate/sulfonate/bicarbonate transport system permease component
MNDKRVLLGLLLLAGMGLAIGTLILARPTAAQVVNPYEVSWYTLDGGGTFSRGGTYVLGGTIGQADAGVLIGGSYTVRGGFWMGGARWAYRIYLPLVVRP